jgi:hypothetical protein
MQQSIIPGYAEIFKNSNETYDEVVKALSSDTLILLASALNNELTSPETREVNQNRLNSVISLRFTKDQNDFLNQSFKDFWERTNKQFKGFVFFRRYLVALILKELNNYREVDDKQQSPNSEFDFLKAYLLIIDEVNQSDHNAIDFKSLIKDDLSNRFKLLWLPSLSQFEYNEKGNIIFETLKSLCFLKFVSEHYKPYLKEYLNKLNLEHPGKLMASFNQIHGSTLNYDERELLRKFTIIKPQLHVDLTHLRSLCINSVIGEKTIRFSELKKSPLFYSNQTGGYIILDNYLPTKKFFIGPFFDLYYKTSLKDQEEFTKTKKQEIFIKYSQDIADVLERTCLCPILTLLDNKKCDNVHFDDETENVPDGYLRIGNKIFLFEYKAYFFPERLSFEPKYEAIKKYLDDRFISNEKGKGNKSTKKAD